MPLLEETQEALIRHQCAFRWIQDRAKEGQIQIAKSMSGIGYVIALLPSKGVTSIKVYTGNLGECIEQAMTNKERNKK